jgi:hypothetical protein
MIEGITVLNQIPVMGASTLTAIGVLIIIFGLFILTVSVLGDEGIGITISIVIIIFGLIFTKDKEIKPNQYTYQVTISDTIKMKEFNDKYIIIQQNGQIYTIKERE